MGHQISRNDFVDIAFDKGDIPYICKHTIASSSGKGSSKSLKVIADIKILTVSFEISSGDFKTTAYTLNDAITLYNDFS